MRTIFVILLFLNTQVFAEPEPAPESESDFVPVIQAMYTGAKFYDAEVISKGSYSGKIICHGDTKIRPFLDLFVDDVDKGPTWKTFDEFPGFYTLFYVSVKDPAYIAHKIEICPPEITVLP